MNFEYPLYRGVGKGQRRLAEDYTLGGYTVPKGSLTDGASVPWFLHWYADDDDELEPSATIHDHLYDVQSCTRKEADDIMHALMLYTDVRESKALVVWSTVRAFGWYPWWKNERRKANGQA